MKTLGFYLTTFLIVFVLGSANAGARTIEMLNKDEAGNKMVYSEELARIEVGETITWLPTSKDTMLNGLLVLTEQNFQRSLRTQKKFQ